MEMNEKELAQELLEFIWDSPSAFHVVDSIRRELLKKGFCELEEKEEWKLANGQKYFVVRNDSSVIAFCLPQTSPKGFHIVASHSDSPTFKVKEKPEIGVENNYVKLNTEKYGGMILSTWLDRPLSVAGRILVRTGMDKIYTKLVNVNKDLLVIPNLAIHMNRDINKGYEYNPQVDMLPLLGLGTAEEVEDLLIKEVARAADVSEEEILSQDLFLYVREKGHLLGSKEELIMSPRLDDLQCVHASLKAFSEAECKDYVNVLGVFDNEEVGSTTRQGADSTFLQDVLIRVKEAMAWKEEAYLRMVAESFMISADNAHAVHPNHPQKADPTNRPYLGGGIVLKYHGGQKYTTDAISAGKMKLWCEKAEVPFQTYCNRSDVAGGSTLGNISNSHISLSTVDIGLPQLAMHSAMETAACSDSIAAVKVFGAFFSE